ncbi:MAG: hypothetical protein KTR31_35460 [Myxococcales bacterium]|nr:hypothetical protein [Myxococcales bacterium]
MRWLLIVGCMGLAGCEGCDFSFGPIGVIVAVTPEDAEGTLELCVEDQGCQEVPLPHLGGSGAAHNEVRFDVSWQGYLVCKHPEVVATVRTEACERRVVRPRQRPRGPQPKARAQGNRSATESRGIPERREGRTVRGSVRIDVSATCDDERS